VIQPNEQAENRWGGWNARLDENGLIMGANPWGNVDPLGGPPGPAG